MADDQLAELLKAQKSLTEWLADIKHSDASLIRKEDGQKQERLSALNEAIDLPFDKPTRFEAVDLTTDNAGFVSFLEEHGDELCALRLIPKVESLPKLRLRGKSITDTYAWYLEQTIEPANYKADFIPHPSDYAWATIFIVNKYGIQGEIIYGGHHHLTQGFHDTATPHVFRYDFKNWTIAPKNDDALAYLKKLTDFIHVPDKAKQKELQEKLDAKFQHDYLVGYFETTSSSLGTSYIDYSQVLGDMYADTIVRTDIPKKKGVVTGQTGSTGRASGMVCIVDPDNLDIDFPQGGILVCEVTTPNYIPLMQKASAIVTDEGGILSHAAIVARELHKPCIVGTRDATKKLKNGDQVLVDADAGIVSLLR